MTVEELKAAFEKHGEEEYVQFKRIERPRHRRPDICAFLMLDDALPNAVGRNGAARDIVAAGEHDEIWLDVELEDLAAVATDDMIRDLSRCGVRYESEGLCMFV